MNRLSLSALLVLFYLVTFAQIKVKEPGIVVPHGFKILQEAKGDLDKDGIPELVVVFNTSKRFKYDGVDRGTERQLCIYKKSGSGWKLWHKCTGPVLSSELGGMMGDPFDDLKIENCCIVIYHFGQDAEKWTYEHRYRYQNNNWYLIGTHITFLNIETIRIYDYNLSTGKINGSIFPRDSDSLETTPKVKDDNFTLIRKPVKPILMDGLKPGENEVKLPGGRESFYY